MNNIIDSVETRGICEINIHSVTYMALASISDNPAIPASALEKLLFKTEDDERVRRQREPAPTGMYM